MYIYYNRMKPSTSSFQVIHSTVNTSVTPFASSKTPGRHRVEIDPNTGDVIFNVRNPYQTPTSSHFDKSHFTAVSHKPNDTTTNTNLSAPCDLSDTPTSADFKDSFTPTSCSNNMSAILAAHQLVRLRVHAVDVTPPMPPLIPLISPIPSITNEKVVPKHPSSTQTQRHLDKSTERSISMKPKTSRMNRTLQPKGRQHAVTCQDSVSVNVPKYSPPQTRAQKKIVLQQSRQHVSVIAVSTRPKRQRKKSQLLKDIENGTCFVSSSRKGWWW